MVISFAREEKLRGNNRTKCTWKRLSVKNKQTKNWLADVPWSHFQKLLNLLGVQQTSDTFKWGLAVWSSQKLWAESRAAIQPFSSPHRDTKAVVLGPDLQSVPSCCLSQGSHRSVRVWWGSVLVLVTQLQQDFSSFSDISFAQGCSHSPASKFAFTSQGREACHKLTWWKWGWCVCLYKFSCHFCLLCCYFILLTLPCFCFHRIPCLLTLCFSIWSTFPKYPY